MKKPNEVLYSKKAICGGLAITLASLLEQTNVDYKLLYLDHHLTIAVEGNYGNTNGLTFDFGGRNYSIAESTTPGFRIGQSILKKPIRVEDIRYVQRPGKTSKVYNAKTGKPVMQK